MLNKIRFPFFPLVIILLLGCGGNKEKCHHLDQDRFYDKGYYHGKQRVKARLAKIDCDKVFKALQDEHTSYLGNETKECFCWGYEAAFK